MTDVVASLLIPVRNEERHLGDIVGALRALRFEQPVEFLFLEGRSDDATRAMLDELAAADPRMRVLDNPRRIVPCALNVGLANARGRYVVQLSAHSRYPPDYLTDGIARMERGDVAQVSGPQLADGGGRWSRRVALALGSWLGIGGATWRRVPEGEIEVTSGWGGIWRRDMLEALGGWDEDFPVNEDAELAARIEASGGRMVCLPEMAARYAPRDSLPGLARQYWRYGHYRVRTTRRHPGSLRRSHLLAPALALSALAAVAGPRRARGAARAGLGVYAIAVASVSVSAARDEDPRDAAALPAVFAVMHLAWGLGFLAGCLRFGPPLRALARALDPRG